MGDLIRTIESLQPAFREQVRLWFNDMKAESIPFWLNEALRTYDRQAHLYAQGRTRAGPIVTKAKPGQSRHNFGFAVDVYPLDKDGDPIWNFNPAAIPWPRIVALAKGRGLKWGGDWRFRDYPHFEFARPPLLAVCRMRWPHGWKP